MPTLVDGLANAYPPIRPIRFCHQVPVRHLFKSIQPLACAIARLTTLLLRKSQTVARGGVKKRLALVHLFQKGLLGFGVILPTLLLTRTKRSKLHDLTTRDKRLWQVFFVRRP